MRRRLVFWRGTTVALAIGIVVALSWRSNILPAGDRIARIDINGIILNNTDFNEHVAALAKDDNVKALIVHIDSPGGTVVGSETLYEAIREVGAGKPVAAVLGEVATSGGYITALAADHVVARRNSITGSIGVIMQVPVVGGLLDKIGIEVDEVKSGPLKGEPSGLRPLSGPARQAQMAMIDDAYAWFLDLVVERRKMDRERARKLADGRIYSGGMAVENGLVDALGSEREAVAWLETEAGIPADLDVVDENPSTPLEEEFGGMFGSIVGRIAGKLGWQSPRMVDGLLALWQP